MDRSLFDHTHHNFIKISSKLQLPTPQKESNESSPSTITVLICWGPLVHLMELVTSTNGISGKIESIIKEADSELFLVSP